MKGVPMKSLIILLSILTLEASASEFCRVAIHDMDKLMGGNSVLIDQVNRNFEKKDIQLITENELQAGDFTIPNFIYMIKNKPNIPKHEYKFKTKSKLVVVPCFALPLCSPVMVDKEVKAIVGIKYKHPYSIKLVGETDSKIVAYKEFKHVFNQKPITWNENIPYDGSADQEDLALAIADEIPKCSKLRKLKI